MATWFCPEVVPRGPREKSREMTGDGSAPVHSTGDLPVPCKNLSRSRVLCSCRFVRTRVRPVCANTCRCVCEWTGFTWHFWGSEGRRGTWRKRARLFTRLKGENWELNGFCHKWLEYVIHVRGALELLLPLILNQAQCTLSRSHFKPYSLIQNNVFAPAWLVVLSVPVALSPPAVLTQSSALPPLCRSFPKACDAQRK